jgi:hypothetical protein
MTASIAIFSAWTMIGGTGSFTEKKKEEEGSVNRASSSATRLNGPALVVPLASGRSPDAVQTEDRTLVSKPESESVPARKARQKKKDGQKIIPAEMGTASSAPVIEQPLREPAVPEPI